MEHDFTIQSRKPEIAPPQNVPSDSDSDERPIKGPIPPPDTTSHRLPLSETSVSQLIREALADAAEMEETVGTGGADDPSRAEIVVDGATCECTKGSGTGELSVDDDGSDIQGDVIANKFDLDFTPFGNCSILTKRNDDEPTRCTPGSISFPWAITAKNYTVRGLPVVLDVSMTFCPKGGIIDILKSGQSGDCKRTDSADMSLFDDGAGMQKKFRALINMTSNNGRSLDFRRNHRVAKDMLRALLDRFRSLSSAAARKRFEAGRDKRIEAMLERKAAQAGGLIVTGEQFWIDKDNIVSQRTQTRFDRTIMYDRPERKDRRPVGTIDKLGTVVTVLRAKIEDGDLKRLVESKENNLEGWVADTAMKDVACEQAVAYFRDGQEFVRLFKRKDSSVSEFHGNLLNKNPRQANQNRGVVTDGAGLEDGAVVTLAREISMMGASAKGVMIPSFNVTESQSANRVMVAHWTEGPRGYTPTRRFRAVIVAQPCETQIPAEFIHPSVVIRIPNDERLRDLLNILGISRGVGGELITERNGVLAYLSPRGIRVTTPRNLCDIMTDAVTIASGFVYNPLDVPWRDGLLLNQNQGVVIATIRKTVVQIRVSSDGRISQDYTNGYLVGGKIYPESLEELLGYMHFERVESSGSFIVRPQGGIPDTEINIRLTHSTISLNDLLDLLPLAPRIIRDNSSSGDLRYVEISATAPTRPAHIRIRLENTRDRFISSLLYVVSVSSVLVPVGLQLNELLNILGIKREEGGQLFTERNGIRTNLTPRDMDTPYLRDIMTNAVTIASGFVHNPERGESDTSDLYTNPIGIETATIRKTVVQIRVQIEGEISRSSVDGYMVNGEIYPENLEELLGHMLFERVIRPNNSSYIIRPTGGTPDSEISIPLRFSTISLNDLLALLPYPAPVITRNNSSNIISRFVEVTVIPPEPPRIVLPTFLNPLLTQLIPGVYIAGREATAELGYSFNIASGIIFDTNGNVGIVDTIGTGGGAIGISFGLYFAYIRAPDIFAIQGEGIDVGFSVGPKLIGGGVEWTVTGGREQFHGIVFSGSVGAGSLIGVHGRLSWSEITYTPDEVMWRIIHDAISQILLTMPILPPIKLPNF